MRLSNREMMKNLALGICRIPLQRTQKGVRILLFHDINENQKIKFAQLIDFLKNNYNVISPEEYDNSLNKGETSFIISFDDGFLSQADIIREILDPLGIKALFFVCAQFVGMNANEAFCFVSHKLKSNDIRHITSSRLPVNWDDLNFLSGNGHVIGAHTISHVRLSSLFDDKELRREVIVSGEIFRSKLNRKVEWFAYPFGSLDSINSKALGIIKQGFKYCCSGLRGINSTSTNPLCITRQHIDLDMPLKEIKKICLGGLDFYYLLQRRKLRQMVY
mgnify:CR=1 FL=1